MSLRWLAGDEQSPVVVVGQRSRTAVDANLAAAGAGACGGRGALGFLLLVVKSGERGDGNSRVVFVSLFSALKTAEMIKCSLHAGSGANSSIIGACRRLFWRG